MVNYLTKEEEYNNNTKHLINYLIYEIIISFMKENT